MIKVSKKTVLCMVLVLAIVGLTYIFFNSKNYEKIFNNELYSANCIELVTEYTGTLRLEDAKEIEKLIESMGVLPLSEANDRIKTPFSNIMRFRADDKIIYELHFGMPEIFDNKAQVLVNGKVYKIKVDFYKRLAKIEKKYNFSLDLF